METAEAARAKCHAIGYELFQLRYQYQFDAIIQHYGAEKLDNTWAGIKWAETPAYATDFNWVTYLDDDLVEYGIDNKVMYENAYFLHRLKAQKFTL